MNTTTEQERKDRILKTLAVGGFIGLLIIIAWISVKLVAFMPSAITSLASLADTVYNYEEPTLTVASDKSSLGTGESATLSWSVPKVAGTFGISYTCLEGVSIDIRSGNGLVTLPCGDIYPLGVTNEVAVSIFSERTRYVDVPFTVLFFKKNAETPTAETTRQILVTNIQIPDEPIAVVPTPTPEPPQPPVAPTPTPEEPTPTPTTPAKPTTPTTPTTPTKRTYTQTYTYGIPVSNPNGFTDLSARFLSAGILGANNQFTSAGYILKGTRGAIQFEVKNIGTKTSSTWTYVVQLPNGTTYVSPKQTALKPNERSVITLGFTVPDTAGAESTTVAVSINDTNLANNSFSSTIQIR